MVSFLHESGGFSSHHNYSPFSGMGNLQKDYNTGYFRRGAIGEDWSVPDVVKPQRIEGGKSGVGRDEPQTWRFS